MEQLSFENLPKAVSELHKKIDILLSLSETTQLGQLPDLHFTIEELIDYLPDHPARQTVYGWVNQRFIPFEKHGKRLYFRRSEIDEWLANGRM